MGNTANAGFQAGAAIATKCKWEDLMIKKTKEGYKVTSEKGKNLGGPYKSKEQAQKRLRQVEFFKHKKG